MKEIKYTKEMLEPIVFSSKTFSNVVREITGNDKVHGGMVAYVKNLIKKYEINYSHFIGGGWSKGTKGIAFNKMTKKNLFDNYLTNNPLKKTCNNNIKNWLFELGVKEKICNKCSCVDEWMGEKLVLQLDHIDGDNTIWII